MDLRAAVVTGSRDLDDREVVWTPLFEFRPHVVIHGACGIDAGRPGGSLRGADREADAWCRSRSTLGIRAACLPMPANWSLHGNRDGPIRNGDMVTVLKGLRARGYECKVFAFPRGESRGTRGAIELFRKAGFEVDVR